MESLDPVFETVEDVLLFIRRRNRLGPEEWEDFHSWVWVKLAETDYAVLRKFEGRGSLAGFLAVVLHRLFLDYRTEKWGKWRPSAKARSLGSDAVELELLLHRDGRRLDEAILTMIVDRRCPRSENELHAIAAELPERRKDSTTSVDWIEEIPSHRPTPDGELLERERESERARQEDALERALGTLAPDERVALRMRFEQGMKLNEIARALDRKPARFYRQFESLLRRLKASMTELIDGADACGSAAPGAEASVNE